MLLLKNGHCWKKSSIQLLNAGRFSTGLAFIGRVLVVKRQCVSKL